MIEDDRTVERLEALVQEQAALRRVATLVARDVPAACVFESVCEEVGSVLGVTTTNLVRYEDDGTATVFGAWAIEGAPLMPLGSVPMPLDGETVGAARAPQRPHGARRRLQRLRRRARAAAQGGRHPLRGRRADRGGGAAVGRGDRRRRAALPPARQRGDAAVGVRPADHGRARQHRRARAARRLARPDPQGGRRRAAAARPRPPRRRAAAAGQRRHRPAARAEALGRRGAGARARRRRARARPGGDRRPARAGGRASIPRCSPTAGSTPRSSRSPSARRCRSTSRSSSTAGSRCRWRRPRTSWSRRRSPTSASTRARRACRSACSAVGDQLEIEVLDDGVGGADPSGRQRAARARRPRGRDARHAARVEPAGARHAHPRAHRARAGCGVASRPGCGCGDSASGRGWPPGCSPAGCCSAPSGCRPRTCSPRC